MNGIELIILIPLIIIIAGIIAIFLNKGTPSLKEMTEDYRNNEEAQEVVELAQELFDKDLRPIVVKKAPKKEKVEEVPEGIVEEPVKKETKSEFPIDKPKKKRKYYPKAK